MLYNKQFKWQDDLIHNVGLTFFKKDWVAKEIVYHPLKFAKRRMEDPEDDRPIRIRYFAAFALKSGKTKERINKFKEIYRNYEKYKDIVATVSYKKDKYYDTSTEELFQKAMKHIGMNGVRKIDKIYEKGLVGNEQEDIS